MLPRRYRLFAHSWFVDEKNKQIIIREIIPFCVLDRWIKGNKDTFTDIEMFYEAYKSGGDISEFKRPDRKNEYRINTLKRKTKNKIAQFCAGVFYTGESGH